MKILNKEIIDEIIAVKYEDTSFLFDIGLEVRFKIERITWDPELFIEIRMDEPGLGGLEWWV